MINLVTSTEIYKNTHPLYNKERKTTILQKIFQNYTHYTYVVVFLWYFMNNQTSRLRKLERNRTSIMTDNLSKCMLCERNAVNKHEILFGRNRQNSMKYGLIMPLCYRCHIEMHRNSIQQAIWKVKAQERFEEVYPELDFLSIFGRNYK